MLYFALLAGSSEAVHNSRATVVIVDLVDSWLRLIINYQKEEARFIDCCSPLFCVPCVPRVTSKGVGKPILATRCQRFTMENRKRHNLTINVPLFKKLRDIIFFCGTFWGGQDFFYPLNCPSLRSGQFRGQKSRGPLKMSREMVIKWLSPQKKLCPKVS